MTRNLSYSVFLQKMLCNIFIDVLILIYFDSALKIKIETDTSNFILINIISQLLVNEE